MAIGSLAIVLAGALSLLTAPRASGQSAGASNSGGADSSTGGNTSTGNASGNGITQAVPSDASLIGIDLGLIPPANTSTGTSTVTTGGANSSGNQAQSGVGQAVAGGSGAGGGVNSSNPFFNPVFNPFFNPFFSGPSAEASNTGTAVASTGGNTGVGNASQNTINTSGPAGLIAADVGLAGPTNTSTGTSTITSGAANATGNVAANQVNQVIGGGGAGGGGQFGTAGLGGASLFNPCTGLPGFFGFSDGPSASAINSGAADASTGNNTSTGNSSVNTITQNQTVSGGLLGVGVNLGGPTNNSSGTSTINSGAANATGNQSSNQVNQACGVPLGGGGGGFGGGGSTHIIPIHVSPGVVPIIQVPVFAIPAGTALAKTGFDVLDMALIAFGVIYAGFLFLTWAKVETFRLRPSGVAIGLPDFSRLSR